jgi:uncharacterized protein
MNHNCSPNPVNDTPPVATQHDHAVSSCCDSSESRRIDLLLWGSLIANVVGVFFYFTFSTDYPESFFALYGITTFELLTKMWWGLLFGIFFVGLLSQVPKEIIIAGFGRTNGLSGLLRATAAGLLLDLCSHGILLVGMKLYQRGATLGQTMAFLIASPWNSLSLTLILMSLIGFWWTMAFVLLSAAVALVTGYLFEKLVSNGVLPANPHRDFSTEEKSLFAEISSRFSFSLLTPQLFIRCVREGLSDSRMILRWILFGVVLSSLIRALVPTDSFQHLFGPTFLGLILTLVATTIIEICSEGSAPIAADLFSRAKSPGNAFVFLMAGVATDYTELMAIKETTKRWKIALFLPLLTVPQIVIIGWIINLYS